MYNDAEIQMNIRVEHNLFVSLIIKVKIIETIFDKMYNFIIV